MPCHNKGSYKCVYICLICRSAKRDSACVGIDWPYLTIWLRMVTSRWESAVSLLYVCFETFQPSTTAQRILIREERWKEGQMIDWIRIGLLPTIFSPARNSLSRKSGHSSFTFEDAEQVIVGGKQHQRANSKRAE